MHVSIKKRGNNASVRIPAAVMEAARLQLNETVDIREENGRIVIEAVRPTEYDLASLLAGITAENLHAEVDRGQGRGTEAV